jgi:hypothetical protein
MHPGGSGVPENMHIWESEYVAVVEPESISFEKSQ